MLASSYLYAMQHISRSVIVPYQADHLFNIVDHVEEYPEFLPWCSQVELMERTPDITMATIHIGYKAIKAKFTTRNVNDRPERMQLNLIEGPFSSFSGNWQFTSVSERLCRVEFNLNYMFSSKLLEKAMGGVFERIMLQLIHSFVARAGQLPPMTR